MEKLRIFISGTQDEMKPERDAVDRAVNSTTLSTGVRAETAASQPQSPRAWIEQQIHECNIYIGVYSHRYGWVIPDENISATEFEFNLARKLGKPILVWIRKLHDQEKYKPNIDRQQQFLNRVSDFSTGHLRQEFDNPADLEKWVTAALSETFTEIIRRSTAPTTSKFLVPFPHNPDFVGREGELSSLHEMLQHGGSIVGIRPTVLVGLGGIGKTQLAVEYAHMHRDDYPSGIFWLNAINPLLFEFSDLAEKLGMADRDTPRDKATSKAWDYLDSHTDALVIFDNILEPSELNVPFSPGLIPANLRCRTLFTTRQRDFPRNFQPFEVKVLPEMAAMRLLLRSRPEVLEQRHPEWGWAQIVCASLGWLPLALELAAAYLGAYPNVKLIGYLQRLRRMGVLEVVDKDTELRPDDLPTRHEVAVKATLQTQWDRLKDKDAQLLFRAAGQFSGASWISIPRLGLLTGIESEAEPGRPARLNVALKKLHAISLIEELSDDRLRLHPLVQEFAALLSRPDFHVELAARTAALDDVPHLQARVLRYGIDMVLDDVRTGLGFCADDRESQAYLRLSSLKRILDRQAHYLRGWDTVAEPNFFLQQLHNESLELENGELRVGTKAELAQRGQPYLCELFKASHESPELVLTLTGHDDEVHGVALSADGRIAVSASHDRTLKVWDVARGQELRTLQGHSSAVTSVALNISGQLAISTSWDQTLKVWDVATGRELHTIKEHGFSVALSADGHRAISASNFSVTVWDVITGRILHTFIGHEHVALSADGRLAVSGVLAESSLKVWDLVTGRELRTLESHRGITTAVALSADGLLAVSASWDKTITVWDVATGRELHTLEGHSHEIHGLALSADGRLAVSVAGYPDNTLKVWDVMTGRELRTLRGHSSGWNSVALSADGRLAIAASNGKTLQVWDISASRQPTIPDTPISMMRAPLIPRELGIDTPTDYELRTFERHRHEVHGVALSADGRLAVSASWDNTLKVWNVVTGRELRTLIGHDKAVYGVALSADGRLAVSASSDKMLKVWDVMTGRELHSLKGQNSDVVAGPALSADGRLVVSVWGDTLMVRDATTGRELRTLQAGYAANCVALSADGRLAIAGSSVHTLKVWDVMTGRELHTLKGHHDGIWGVALSADGRMAVSGSDDCTLKVWDVMTGRELRTLQRHSGWVRCVALSADGRLAASTSYDSTLRVWDIAVGQVVSTLPTGTRISCCSMTPGGKMIVAGDVLGGIHFLELVGADADHGKIG